PGRVPQPRPGDAAHGSPVRARHPRSPAPGPPCTGRHGRRSPGTRPDRSHPGSNARRAPPRSSAGGSERKNCPPPATTGPVGGVRGFARTEEIGKTWKSDLQTPFCSIGDPSRLWVVLPVGPAEYRLLKEDLEEARTRQADLEAAIRVRGRFGYTWAGKVAQL